MCKLGRAYAPPSQARPGAGARLAPLVLVLCPSPGPPGRGLAPGRGSKDIFTAIITQYQRNRTAACNRGPLPCMSRARQNHSISKHIRYRSIKLRYRSIKLRYRYMISKILRYRSSQISKQNIRYRRFIRYWHASISNIKHTISAFFHFWVIRYRSLLYSISKTETSIS